MNYTINKRRLFCIKRSQSGTVSFLLGTSKARCTNYQFYELCPVKNSPAWKDNVTK